MTELEMEGQTEILHHLVHSPNGCNARAVTCRSQEPEAPSAPSAWAVHCLPSLHYQGGGFEVEQQGHEPVPIYGAT